VETTDKKPPGEISIAAVRLPLFLTQLPAAWFTQAAAQFPLPGITTKQTKFSYMI
jgi:hypothetical protein